MEYGMGKGAMSRVSKYFLLLDFLYDQSMMDGVVRNGDCVRKKLAEITGDSEISWKVGSCATRFLIVS